MSIDTPNGILDITNAIVRVSKLEFQQATGFDTVLNNIARNTILLSDSDTYETTTTYHNWALKLPNAWVFEADVYLASGTSGGGDHTFQLNFYNNVNTAITNGYTLGLDGTSLTLSYDGTQISTATLSASLNDDAWHKLFVLFERDTFAVAVDGKPEYTFTDSVLRDRVYNDDAGYVVFYHEAGVARKIKNLKFVNGDKWIRESGSSNIAYIGGSVGIGTDAPKHTLDVLGNANVGALTSTGIYGEIVGSNAVGASTGTFSGDLQVGTANLFVDVSTSNVGIGTDTPMALLDVQGDFSAGPSANLFVDATTGHVGISNTAPAHTLDVGSNLYVQDGGDTVLYVDGNVSVSNKLTVQSFRISSSSSSGLQAVTTGIGANSTTNRIEITNADNSTSTSTGALALTNGGLGVAGDVVAGGSLTLASDLAVDTNTLKVDAANNRVGILTASPAYGLDVHGTANVGALTATSSTVSGALSAGSATVTGQLLVDTDTLTVDAVNDRVGVNTASPSVDLDVVGEAKVSGNVAVNTNTLFVDSVNSRVGVGTTEPSEAFEVSGNVQVGTANLFVDTTTGNVGIGMTDPGHNLDIVGEMNLRAVSNTASIKYNSNVATEYVRSKRIEKFPRVAMTGNSAPSPYVASSSSNFNSDTVAWRAFNNIRDIQYLSSAQYNYQTGLYEGSTSTTVSGTSISGEWLQIKLAEKMELVRSFYVSEAYDGNAGFQRAPQLGTIAGSNDGTTWTLVHRYEQSGTRESGDYVQTGGDVKPNAGYYQYYRLICEKTSAGYTSYVLADSANYFSVAEWQLFGYPEDGSAVTDSDLVMHSEPKVPVNDGLRLYWDFGDYTSKPSTITDKSGNGFTGTVNGSTTTFDNEYKAITFGGVYTDNVSTSFTVPVSDFVHSVAFWVRGNDGSIQNFIFNYGPNSSGTNNVHLGCHFNDDLVNLRYYFYGNDRQTKEAFRFQTHRWYHVCLTYSGKFDRANTRKIYIDGHIRSSEEVGTQQALNLPTSGNLFLGRTTYSTGADKSYVSIANFRIYERVIQPQEVLQLYDYQKEFFQKKSTSLCFAGGRLGVGTREPTATLDVNGDIRAGENGVLMNRAPYYFARQANIGGYWNDAAIRYNAYVRTNYPGEFAYIAHKANGICVPKNGVYHVTVSGHIGRDEINLHVQTYDWKDNSTIYIADLYHLNYSAHWESISATGILMITDKDRQCIRVVADWRSGDGYGIWAAGNQHGCIAITWISDA